MNKTFVVEHREVKSLWDDDLSVGDYIKHNGKLYKFDGYEYGTYPYGIDLETGKQVQLPSY